MVHRASHTPVERLEVVDLSIGKAAVGLHKTTQLSGIQHATDTTYNVQRTTLWIDQQAAGRTCAKQHERVEGDTCAKQSLATHGL
jgi:hypothetical protein